MSASRRVLLAVALLVVIGAGVLALRKAIYGPAVQSGSGAEQVQQAVTAAQVAQGRVEQAINELRAARAELDRRGVRAVYEAVQSARELSGDAVADGLNDVLARFRGGTLLPAGDGNP